MVTLSNNPRIMYNFDWDNNILQPLQRRFFFSGPAYTGRTRYVSATQEALMPTLHRLVVLLPLHSRWSSRHKCRLATTQYVEWRYKTPRCVNVELQPTYLLILVLLRLYWGNAADSTLLECWRFGQGKRTMTPNADFFEGNHTALRYYTS